MLAIGFDVDAEIFVMLRSSEAVMLFQSVDLRFADRGNLTLVGIKRDQTFRRRCFGADFAERLDQGLRLRLFLCLCKIDTLYAEGFRDPPPKLGMIGRPGFFSD